MSRWLLCAVLVLIGHATEARADRPVHRISTAYADGLTSDPEDWVDCQAADRGWDPAWSLPDLGGGAPEGATIGDCVCTRDTVRLAAAIKGFTAEGVAYEAGDIEIEGTIYLNDIALYPAQLTDGEKTEAGPCTVLLGGPRIRDDVIVRGVETEAGPPTVNGATLGIWTPSVFGEPQPEPTEVLIEDLWFENAGPAVQTGSGSWADVVLRDLVVHATQWAPSAPAACPGQIIGVVMHHTGSLWMENVSVQANADPNLPVPEPAKGCGLPNPARAIGMAVGLAPDLDVVVRESTFEILDLDGAPLDQGVGLYAIFNPGTSIDITETTFVADRGTYANFLGGPLSVSESIFHSGSAGIAVDNAGALLTRENEVYATGDGVGMQLRPGTGPSYLGEDVLTGTAATGLEIHGENHQVVEMDLSNLDAEVPIDRDACVNCTFTEVVGD